MSGAAQEWQKPLPLNHKNLEEHVMKIKKLLSTALVLCLMAGCGGKDNPSGSSQSQTTHEPPFDRPADAITVVPLGELPSRRSRVELIQFQDKHAGPVAVMRTSMGDIRIALYPEEAPLAVENFITHAKNGYYNGLTFHRIVEGFMIQGGDPKGNGTGGESAFEGGTPFADEFSDKLHHFRGALSMANSGVNTNGSQFFIVQSDEKPQESDKESVMMQFAFNELERQLRVAEKESGASAQAMEYMAWELNVLLESLSQNGLSDQMKSYYAPAFQKYMEVGGTMHLDYKHTVFGHVLEGMDVVDAIAAVEVNNTTPVKPVIINSISIEE